jgi:hypothetical protein
MSGRHLQVVPGGRTPGATPSSADADYRETSGLPSSNSSSTDCRSAEEPDVEREVSPGLAADARPSVPAAAAAGTQNPLAKAVARRHPSAKALWDAT